MPIENEGSLDDLMMGNASEGISESDEKFSERVQAAQQKIAAIKKDEKKAKNFDQKLSQIISQLTPTVLDFVILLINFEVPSLTILAFISLVNEDSASICFIELKEQLEPKEKYALMKLGFPEAEERIAYWWAFIFAADQTSATLKLKKLRDKEEFITAFSKHMAKLLITFLEKYQITEYDPRMLQQTMAQYEKMMFEG